MKTFINNPYVKGAMITPSLLLKKTVGGCIFGSYEEIAALESVGALLSIEDRAIFFAEAKYHRSYFQKVYPSLYKEIINSGNEVNQDPRVEMI